MPLIVLVFIAFIVRLIYLDSIPAELYGDVIEHIGATNTILTEGLGHWNHWYGGDGPLHPYSAAFLSLFFGNIFWTHKLCSSIFGALSVMATYLYALKLSKSKKIAVYAGIFVSFSFWSLSLSHQGKPHIATSFFAPLIIYFLMTSGKLSKAFAGILTGVATYSQAAAWGLVGLVFYSPISFLTWISLATGMIYDAWTENNSPISRGSYVDQKIMGNGILELITKTIQNIFVFTRGLFANGDKSIRLNIEGMSLLDEVSQICFVLGVIYASYLFIKGGVNKKSFLLYFILPSLFSIAPAMADVNSLLDHPNMGRVTGFIPFAGLLIGYGLSFIEGIFSKSLWLARFVVISLLSSLIILNLYRFWFVYPQYLPNKNTPFGRLIAEALDDYGDQHVKKYQIECCWGELGQPEPGAINYVSKYRQSVPFTPEDKIKTICQDGIYNRDIGKFETITKGNKYIFVSRPDFSELDFASPSCLEFKESKLIEKSEELAGRIIIFDAK